MAVDHRLILRPSEPPPANRALRPSDPFELWQLAALSAADFHGLGSVEGTLSLAQLQHLAAYGLLAPSSHNTVPQRFLFPSEGNTIEICVDREVVLGASDPSGRQASVSVGCGITNLLHAAGCYGFDAAVELFDSAASRVLPHRPQEARYTRVARVRFQRGTALEPEAVLLAMIERRSVRADYNAAVALPAALMAALNDLMRSQYPELEFHLVHDPRTLGFLADLQELADSTALSREEFTTELGNWLIENDSDSPLGMRGREHGLSDELTQSVQARLLSEIRLRPEEVSGLARGANIGIRSSSAVGIIVAPRDDLQHRVLAGRAFEDLVLTLHQRGFVTAMHAAITELESPNLALQAQLGTLGRPVVVFRMGQPLEPRDARRPHSARPSVSDVTLVESQLSLLPTPGVSSPTHL
ncbi:MAG: hypothetical protein ABI895_26875 [Deltaproteobacteria bacterium]